MEIVVLIEFHRALVCILGWVRIGDGYRHKPLRAYNVICEREMSVRNILGYKLALNGNARRIIVLVLHFPFSFNAALRTEPETA